MFLKEFSDFFYLFYLKNLDKDYFRINLIQIKKNL